MANKFTAFVLLLVVAYAAGNPAAGVEWRWKSRQPIVTPNLRAMPFQKFVETFEPIVRIPGTHRVTECGMRRTQGRIIGGTEVAPHSYPWQVALFYPGGFFCGGALISQEWILTAAHCSDGMAYVQVVAGAHNIQQHESTVVTQVSTTIIVHENWASFTLRNDLSLIRVPTPFPLTAAISPVCLPTYGSRDLPVGTFVTPTGWGITSDGGSISPVLRSVRIPVISQASCQSVFGLVTSNQICMSTAGPKSTCSGDSGGPLNYDEGGRATTRGITSFGSQRCESGTPAVFTRVNSYLAWIETHTGIYIRS